VERGKWRAEGRGEGRGCFYLLAVGSVRHGLDHHGLGRCGAFWTALWSRCSDVAGLVEGKTVSSETCSFQSACTACRARLRHSGRLWLRGGSVEGSAHDAVQARMRHGSGLLSLGWERRARSGRSWLAGDRAKARR
jgi:hypothetical protein